MNPSDEAKARKILNTLAMYGGPTERMRVLMNPSSVQSKLPPEIIEHNRRVDEKRAARLERRRANR